MDTYAPMAHLDTIQILLSFTYGNDFKLFQMDVNSAFLVAYDPRRHQDTIPRRRRSPFARAHLSAYLISLLRTFDPHVFKRVLVYFPLLFRLSGGFFPFRDPIREAISLCGPLFFYEYF